MTKRRTRGKEIVEQPEAVEASLWRRFRFEKQADCKEPLFNRHLELSQSIAGKEFARRPAYGLELGDFKQLAYSGLLEAIDRFDPLQGTTFPAYASPRIRGAISDGSLKSSEAAEHFGFRQRRGLERAAHFVPDIGLSGEQDQVSQLAELAVGLALGLIAESAAAAADPESELYGSIAWREMQIALHQEISKLPENARIVMELHYRDGVSFAQIAELLGLSPGRISQLHRSALGELRDQLRNFE